MPGAGIGGFRETACITLRLWARCWDGGEGSERAHRLFPKEAAPRELHSAGVFGTDNEQS